MSDLTEKKTMRSKQKGKVTKCISKLKSALIYCSDNEMLKEKADTLENEFDSLLDLQEECIELGADDESYLLDITSSFQECMKTYFASIEAQKKIKLAKEAEPLKNLIERDFSRIQSILERIYSTLKLDSSEVEKLNISELEEDQAVISSIVSTMSDHIAKVNEMTEDNGKLEEKMTSLMSRIDKAKRDVSVFIKSHNSILDPQANAFRPNQFQKSENETDSSAQPSRANLSYSMNHQDPSYDTVYTKRPSLPVFSGNRSDWPEFKAVWKFWAEHQFRNPLQLAMELKKCCRGKAAERVKHIYVTHDQAYESIWSRLEEEYDDAGLCVQSALSRLVSLKPVASGDHGALVKFVDSVEGVHSQLKELNQLSAVHTVDVDRINMLLPRDISVGWLRKYKDLPTEEKLKPFSKFLEFLGAERSVVARLVNCSPKGRERGLESRKAGAHNAGGRHDDRNTNRERQPRKGPNGCVIHSDSLHLTENCRNFLKLSIKNKYDELKKKRRCFKCFKSHPKSECNAEPCTCGKDHHVLLCNNQEKRRDTNTPGAHFGNTEEGEEDNTVKKEAHLVDKGCKALYPINHVRVDGTNKFITVFADVGSNASYVTEACAAKLRLKRLKKVALEVAVVGGDQREYKSTIFEIPLCTKTGKIVKISAYSLESITGTLSQLDVGIIKKLFPNYDASALMRKSNTVDLLIGTDYFGLHPKRELAKAGKNLSIMDGELGPCIVGSHPDLQEDTLRTAKVPEELHGSCARTGNHHIMSHPAFNPPNNFFQGEEIATEINPRCGGCKCGKCPIPGHTLSFKEEQELGEIRDNLEYDAEKNHWVTSYPWIVDPLKLPDNSHVAKAILNKTEKTLMKEKEWAKSYGEQMEEMISRGAARKLSTKEDMEWEGPKFYINHLAVVNPKSKSTPIRIVFNSSHVYQGISLNNCLAKGPDSFVNSSIGILLRWREEAVAIVGDIKKMFHSVFLKPLEQHCHRFLWRGLDRGKEPDIYVMTRVNMGDRPASAIATEAMYQTAERERLAKPKAAEFIQRSAYVDDLIGSTHDITAAKSLAEDVQQVLDRGGFRIKEWTFTGDDRPTQLKGTQDQSAVLGVIWDAKSDTICFQPMLNFSPKRHSAFTKPNLTATDPLPENFTRRMVLQQVMAIYDPLGLLSPFTLKAKILLRKTWEMKLDWDDILPQDLYLAWVQFFKEMFEIKYLKFQRCVKPKDAVGNPWLILLSDGSEIAYGCMAYARWTCKDGSVVTRLLMAKSRIGPVAKVSTPRMELNGAVLSKRCRVVLEREMNYTFEKVVHLIDSETVLNQINKTSYRFRVYEGVRIGEIQAASSGDMSEWAWLPGKKNTADWLTRGCTPSELNQDSEWQNGPLMLSEPLEKWDIKYGSTSSDPLPGEKRIVSTNTSSGNATQPNLLNYTNVSSLQKAVRVVARIMGMAKDRSFRGGHVDSLSAETYKRAEGFLLLEAQREVDLSMKQYKPLNPMKTTDGLWVVGANRLSSFNPLNTGGIRADLPIFIPKAHPLAELAMKAAHCRGHRGRDATVSLFRNRFWTPSAGRLGKRIRDECQLCRLRDGVLMKQVMGSLPIERSKPSPPFNHCMVDLFGPYQVRGEVQKRITGKAWGVIFTDMCSRAVHIEAIFGYDTSNFLLALSRFASIRGWPSKIFSDPGSQLTAADKEINQAASRVGINHGMDWIVGPADSPWYQGAVESLVKTTKRALKLAINEQRLSVPEFLTILTEAANTINERPIGLLPSLDSTINVLTPNCLLLGRATSSNPGSWQPGNTSIKTRYHLVTSVGEDFWKYWLQLFAPSLLYQSKWHSAQRDLQVGDVVLVSENSLRGTYRLAQVKATHPGRDGKVRIVTISYKNYRVGESIKDYGGAKDTLVRRGVQRLVLITPIEQKE